MNLSFKEAATVTAASIALIAAAAATDPKSIFRPAPTENLHKSQSMPVCVKTANTYICKAAP